MTANSGKKYGKKQRLSTRRQYFGELAHELRTPLTVIKGRVELLLLKFRGRELPGKIRKELQSIDEEIDHMAEILAKKIE